MTKISAPYNFVPLNKQVYFPEWAPFISHDIPFKDGLSGEIKLNITAESPIFIGSGKKIKGVQQFCQDSNGRYFIPGSSIRNMLRSVVEIMSFGKLNIINSNYNFKSTKHIKDFKEHLKLFQENYNENFDLAECIFGAVDEVKNKGRIAVGHAFIKEDTDVSKKYELVLNSPKPSFYPFYLEQESSEIGSLTSLEYVDYKNPNFSIRGRKRYPIHYKFEPEKIVPNERKTKNKKKNNTDVKTSFKPLNIGCKFDVKAIYHNLLPIELGAILSAITFHNTANCRHNIGFAKPYGFGKVNIEVEGLDVETQMNCMGLFEKAMESFNNGWLKSIQLQELISMASLYKHQDKTKLKYMNFEEYGDVKKAKKALPRYSAFMGVEPKIESQIKDNEAVDLGLDVFKRHNKLIQKIEDLEKQLSDENSPKLKADKKGNVPNKKLETISKNKKTDNLPEGYFFGVVKFFNEGRGFGFIIEANSKKEYFVHISKLLKETILRERDEVIFTIGDGRKGKEATDVEIFNEIKLIKFKDKK